MQKLLTLTLLAALATTCQAREPMMAPTPADSVFYQPEPTPASPTAEPQPGTIITSSQPIELYQNVRVIQHRNVHPCAVPMVVAIPNPCDPCCGCVYVEICVPPCDPLCIRCTRGGNRIIYDFGKYGVKLTSRPNGVVIVDYDD